MSGAGGPGTNPEQLFAVGYAACFQSTLMGVARGRKLDASDTRITSRVGIGPTGHGGFTLSVSLDLHAPQPAYSNLPEGGKRGERGYDNHGLQKASESLQQRTSRR
jgi:organic hydroperoxide reductase OsmC/OhrA